eukprot:7884801-Pyramimonas_sp.AAC.1
MTTSAAQMTPSSTMPTFAGKHSCRRRDISGLVAQTITSTDMSRSERLKLLRAMFRVKHTARAITAKAWSLLTMVCGL